VLRKILVAGQASGDFDVEPVEGILLAISSLCVDVCRWFPSKTFRQPGQVGALYADLAAKIVGRGAGDTTTPGD
jgi:hypothetical protein